MTQTLKCVSPVDEPPLAERPQHTIIDVAATGALATATQKRLAAITQMNNSQFELTASLRANSTERGDGLSVIGYHNRTRPKFYHLKKA